MRVAAGVLVVVGALAALPAAGETRRGPVGFRLSGSVEGLYPGVRRAMKVTVRNPFARTMLLVSIRGDVGRAGRACSGHNVDVRPFRGRLGIPARRRRVVRMLVAMAPTAAEQCKRARFPIRFRAKAVLR
jgi:hypothetical protein